MSNLSGTWVLETSENFDQFMKELGLGLILRKAGNMVTPTLIISNEGQHWSVNIRSTFKNNDEEFNIGEEFEHETIDGRKVKCLYNIDGDKLVCHQKDRKTGVVQATATKSIQDGKLVEVLVCNNVTSRRVFKKVE